MQNFVSPSGPRIAILVDAENISADNWPAIARLFSGLGAGMSLTCFGDFTNRGHAGWLEICRRNNGTAIMVLSNGAGKNGADIALTITAMELLQNQAAEMIVVASSDSDFVPLAHRISAAGCIAIGVGRANASEDLRRAFDRYLVLPPNGRAPAAAPISKARPAASPLPQGQPGAPAGSLSSEQVQFLATLIERLAQKDPDGAVLLSHLGLALRKEYPALGELLAKGKLRKALRHYGIASEHGEGTAIKVAPAA